jgi:hypothetical protein
MLESRALISENLLLQKGNITMDDIAPPLVWILCFTVLTAFLAAVTGYFISRDALSRVYGRKNSCQARLCCPHCGTEISIALTAEASSAGGITGA